MGDLKRIVREALGEQDMQELDGFRVGEFYKDKRGNVSRLIRIYTRPARDGSPLTMAVTQFVDFTRQQRFDVWASEHQPATDAETKAQQERDEATMAYMAKNIDTSKEGT